MAFSTLAVVHAISEFGSKTVHFDCNLEKKCLDGTSLHSQIIQKRCAVPEMEGCSKPGCFCEGAHLQLVSWPQIKYMYRCSAGAET